MPYIKKSERKKFSKVFELLGEVFDAHGVTPGDLNYLFTIISAFYIEFKGQNYTHYNDIVGALENCKLELYRRKISKYEDTKIENPENGDIY